MVVNNRFVYHRFGRWRGWIEKRLGTLDPNEVSSLTDSRAAERYADISVEELERRRARGWGNGLEQELELVMFNDSIPRTRRPNLVVWTGDPSGRTTPSPEPEPCASLPYSFADTSGRRSSICLGFFNSSCETSITCQRGCFTLHADRGWLRHATPAVPNDN